MLKCPSHAVKITEKTNGEDDSFAMVTEDGQMGANEKPKILKVELSDSEESRAPTKDFDLYFTYYKLTQPTAICEKHENSIMVMLNYVPDLIPEFSFTDAYQHFIVDQDKQFNECIDVSESSGLFVSLGS